MPEHPRSDWVGQPQNGPHDRDRFQDDRPDEARPSLRALHHIVLSDATQSRYGNLDRGERLSSILIPAVVPLATGPQSKHGDLAGGAHPEGALCGPPHGGDDRAPRNQGVVACQTISTVGYGDRYPVTNDGRLAGTLIIIVDVGIFGTFTGYLAN